SPGIRQTWEARITAPVPLKVVMSGERLTPNGLPAGPGRRAWRFRMTHPVPPYLIAIAAGDLAFRPLGRRTGVWTEPAWPDLAAHRFARHVRRRGRQQRHRLRQGRDLPAHNGTDRRSGAVRRLAAKLFRPACLRADDLGALPRGPARQPHPRRPGAGAK